MLTTDELMTIDNETVFNAILKSQAVLTHHKRVVASISGGSDSDIVLDMLERTKNENNIIEYVWFDTGVEYQATKDHLIYLEKRYGVEIKRLKAQKTIPTCCREYGQPFLSKYVSEMIERLQKHDFNWEDEPYEVLEKRYANCKTALRWWCNYYTTTRPEYARTSAYDIARFKWLKEFLILNPPTFRISSQCCTYAKKKVAKHYIKEAGADLNVFGVRRAEGGIRATSFDTCYSHDSYSTPTFRPIFWLNDSDKAYYEERFGIVHSDCYSRYGLRRTGCVGCPYGRYIVDELAQVERFEPKLIRACRNLFRDAYEYTRQYRQFYAVMQDTEKHQISGQMTIYDMEGER